MCGARARRGDRCWASSSGPSAQSSSACGRASDVEKLQEGLTVETEKLETKQRQLIADVEARIGPGGRSNVNADRRGARERHPPA